MIGTPPVDVLGIASLRLARARNLYDGTQMMNCSAAAEGASADAWVLLWLAQRDHAAAIQLAEELDDAQNFIPVEPA